MTIVVTIIGIIGSFASVVGLILYIVDKKSNKRKEKHNR